MADPRPRPGDPDAPTPPARPDLYVVARFLDALRAPGPKALTRSRLQLATRLNYDLFRTYLVLMEAKGFLRWEVDVGGKEVAHITHEGIRAHAELCGWIRRVLGNGRL